MADETVDETFAGILDGEEETLRERLGTPEPEPDSISEDEAALRSRNQRAWMASEGHIHHNRHATLTFLVSISPFPR